MKLTSLKQINRLFVEKNQFIEIGYELILTNPNLKTLFFDLECDHLYFYFPVIAFLSDINEYIHLFRSLMGVLQPGYNYIIEVIGYDENWTNDEYISALEAGPRLSPPVLITGEVNPFLLQKFIKNLIELHEQKSIQLLENQESNPESNFGFEASDLIFNEVALKIVRIEPSILENIHNDSTNN